MSWYNLDGVTVQITGLEDLTLHDVLRIPNWPTQQAAAAHKYTLNTAQAAAVATLNIGITAANPSAGLTPPGAAETNAGVQAAASLNPLAPLFQGNIWIRVAEFALGLVLIAVGVAKLTGAVPIATKVAKTAGAVALA